MRRATHCNDCRTDHYETPIKVNDHFSRVKSSELSIVVLWAGVIADWDVDAEHGATGACLSLDRIGGCPGNRKFYGDRSAGIKDAWDNQWWIATHVEDVNDEEMKRRAAEFRKQ